MSLVPRKTEFRCIYEHCFGCGQGNLPERFIGFRGEIITLDDCKKFIEFLEKGK